MADGPGLVIRVSANLSELKAALSEGVTQVETTRASLNNMSNAFDGSRTIAQAGAVVGALLQIGDVTKLTAAEQAKANQILEAGLDKYQALGREAPPGMRELATATKQVQHEHVNLLGTLSDVAAAFGLAWSVERSIEFFKTVAEEAHQLHVLSLQTQINVGDLQVLSAATKEYGVDGEQLGRALFQLSRRIAGGDESVATAYHLMGISLDDIRDKQGLELFLATERGLGTLHGTIRDTAAADLYGGRLGVSMGAFATGVDEAIGKARQLNTIASEESVKASAEYANAIDRATRSLHAWFMEVEGGAAQGFNTINDAATKGASTWDLFKAVFTDWTNSSLRVGAHADALATLLDHLAQQTEKGKDITLTSARAHETATTALDAHGQAARFMAALELDSAKPLLAWQTEYLEHLHSIGELTAQNAAGIGVSVNQLKLYEAQTRQNTEATKAWNALLVHMDQETFKLANEHEKQWREEQLKRAELVTAAVVREFEAQVKLNAEWGLHATGALNLQQTALDIYMEKLTALHKIKQEGISQAAQEQLLIDEYTRSLYEEATAIDRTTLALDTLDKQKAAMVSGPVALSTRYLLPADRNLWDAFLVQFGPSARPAQDDLGQWYAYIPGVNAPPPQQRALGGPVMADKPYVVGERGPELFVPASAGTIVPNGGNVGTTIHVTINTMMGNPQEIARVVGESLMANQRALGVRMS